MHARRRQARVGVDQLPHQLLAHRQHMSVTVGLGHEGMGNGRRCEEEHRAGFDVLLIIEIHPHGAALDVVHLEEPVVAMNRHVAAEKIRQVGESVVMHFGVAVALVVHLTNVDVGDRLTVSHHAVLVFLFWSRHLPHPSCTESGKATSARSFCHA
ncbi:hypothetical protein D3C76_1035240 [compost metagenome]